MVSAAFIIALGFGLIAPILPQYARSFDVSIFAASFVVSVFAVFRLMFAPLSGRMVNGVGYRKTYLTGLTVVAVSTLAVAAAQNYWQLIIFRAVGGIGSTMFTVSAMGLIARIAPPAIRGRCSATYGSAFLLGSIIGPVLGAAMASWGMRIPFLIYGFALLVAVVIVAIRLDAESLRQRVPRQTAPAMTFREATQDPAYRSVLCSGFATGWTNFGVRVAIIPLFAGATFSRGPAVAGIALTVFALGTVLSMQFSGSLSDRIGRRPVLLTGLIINGLFTGIFGFMHTDVAVLVVSLLAGFGAGMVNPVQQAVIADVIGAEKPGGKVLANYQMAQDMGMILGPLVVGAIVDAAGFQVGFAVCGVLMAMAALIWLFGRESAPEKA
ncbi:MFS transporter [Corynebacterium sp. TAE3-ERU12]|uniref:MFS transporter n=1 Tax=Corynebacterium sp. TAE3-ERU12 TaxID=2849491 RepID=UPI001C495320|nr:MFS transporter [Corynebacterium sp. TAE3-ERU12]MBV7295078.1 MFS transporter [Corynebacterium sp. TAE3-ERU12]